MLFPTLIGAADPLPERRPPPTVPSSSSSVSTANPGEENFAASAAILPVPAPRNGGSPAGAAPPQTVPIARASPQPSSATRWVPPLNTSWQWQLTTPVDLTVSAQMYDIDLFSNDESIVTALHRQGKHVVCYISAGTWEPNRPDSSSFPATVLGASYGGAFADERWLDVRQITVLAPIMQARMDLCKQRGFDAIEADNVDGYANTTGFPLTANDQLTYNRWLSQQAHARGLSIGLKNEAEQVPSLVSAFDWSLVEQCFDYNECNRYTPFVTAGKAVFVIEYDVSQVGFCAHVNSLNFNGMFKNLVLDAYRVPCR